MGSNATLDDAGLVAALQAAGYSARDSALLVAFVPSAFAQPVLEKLGVGEIAESVSARDKVGEWVQVPLSKVSIYQQALAIARGQLGAGSVDPEHYRQLALRSAELNVASNALNTGADVKGATLATALISVTAEDLGHGSWFSRLRQILSV